MVRVLVLFVFSVLKEFNVGYVNTTQKWSVEKSVFAYILTTECCEIEMPIFAQLALRFLHSFISVILNQDADGERNICSSLLASAIGARYSEWPIDSMATH